jgi:tetratricopeptide (TPR) repeat protein
VNTRALLLATLAAAYGASGASDRIAALAHPNRFDAFLPLARAVELRIGAGRFAEAQPLADTLAHTYPTAPLIAFWRAQIRRGLGDAAGEASAWEDYVRLSETPAEACPAIAEAYARGGRADRALDAYRRCAGFAPEDSDRLLDLGDAYQRAGRGAEAAAAFARALPLDPDNPWLAARLSKLQADAR